MIDANLVVINGWAMPQAVWGDFIKAMEVSGEVTFVDLNRSWTIDQWLSFLDESVQAPALWLGWSLGGMIAMKAASIFPDRCVGLSLINSSPSFLLREDWNPGQPKDLLESMEKLVKASSASLIKRFAVLQTLGSDGARAESNALQRMMDPNSEVFDSAVLLNGLGLLADLDCRREFASLSCPLQVILGTTDKVVLTSAEQFKQLNPTVQVTEVEGMGHYPFLHFAEDVVGEIRSFGVSALSQSSGLTTAAETER